MDVISRCRQRTRPVSFGVASVLFYSSDNLNIWSGLCYRFGAHCSLLFATAMTSHFGSSITSIQIRRLLLNSTSKVQPQAVFISFMISESLALCYF